MHRCPACYDHNDSCNAYCVGVNHADVIYLSPREAARPPAEQLQHVRQMHGSSTSPGELACDRCTIVSLSPAPEAPAKAVRMPFSRNQHATVPYLVRYRIPQEGATP